MISGIFLIIVRCSASEYQCSFTEIKEGFSLLTPWEDICHYKFKISCPFLFLYNKPLFLQPRLLENMISVSEG